MKHLNVVEIDLRLHKRDDPLPATARSPTNQSRKIQLKRHLVQVC